MELKKLFVILAIVFAAVVYGATARADMMPGSPLGSFSLETSEGGELDPVSLKRPFIVAFFISAGDKSADELKALQEMLKKDKFADYTAIAVMRGMNDREKISARDYLKEHKIDIQLVFDSKGNAFAKRFGITANLLPSFYIFDAQGIFRASAPSVINPTNRLSFEDYMDRVLAREEIPLIDMVPKNPKNEFQLKLLGKKAPDFKITGLNGRNYSLSDYKGTKNVLLVFWSPYCSHCQKELPKIQSYYNANRLKYNFEVLAITGGGDKERDKATQDFARSSMITYPVLIDENSKASTDYGVRGVPLVFFINRDGVVVDFISGEAKSMEKLYDSVLRDTDVMSSKNKEKQ